MSQKPIKIMKRKRSSSGDTDDWNETPKKKVKVECEEEPYPAPLIENDSMDSQGLFCTDETWDDVIGNEDEDYIQVKHGVYYESQSLTQSQSQPEYIDDSLTTSLELSQPLIEEITPQEEEQRNNERKTKLKSEWAKILPKLKRTKCSCDLFESDCEYHFPEKKGLCKPFRSTLPFPK